MGGAVFLPCLLFDLWCFKREPYRLLSGARSWQPSRRAHANEYSPELPLSLCLFLQWAAATSSHSTSTGDPPIPAGNVALNPVKSLLFSPGSWCARDLMFTPKSGVSVSPSPVKFLPSNPRPSKPDFLWASSSHCRTPRVRSLTWGSELSLPWESCFAITIF